MEVSGVAPGPGPAGSARVDVIVPLKRLGEAKSRLAAASTALPAPAAGPAAHRALVLAMVRDTLAAARAARLVGRLVVVTAEEHLDLDGAGDAPEIVGDPAGGLNAALRAGADHLRATPGPSGPPRAVAALQADLPALHAAELDDALATALARLVPEGTAPAAFVADRQGTGTTLLVTAPGRIPRPRFGPGSAGAHRGTGAVDLDGDWPGLRSDVDTPVDLDRVRTLDCGPATRAWPGLVLACRS